MRPGRRRPGRPRRASKGSIWAAPAGWRTGSTRSTLSYVREGAGHALIGARQWIPAGQISDPVRSLLAGLPLDLEFRTKGQLAVDIVADVRASGVEMDFVCGDEVYGNCTELREELEAEGRRTCCGYRRASGSPWPGA